MLIPDLRGHGSNAVVGERADLTRWTADLAELLDERGHQHATMVGHSLGAQVAMYFAQRYPQQVSSLFLIDPVLRQALHRNNRWLLAAAPLLAVAAASVRALNRIGIHRRRIEPLDLRELDRAARIALQSPENTDAFIRQYSSTRANLKHIRVAQYLQDVVELLRPPPVFDTMNCPVHVLLSTGATFADEAATRRELVALPKQSKLTIARIDCHHWPITERPEEVREAIERWVNVSEPRQ